MKWRLFSSKKSFWGIDVGASSVKTVRFLRTGRGFRLLDVGLKEVPIEKELNQAKIIAALAELIPVPKKEKAVISFSSLAPLIRSVSLPIMPKKEMAEAVKWEAKKLVSIAPEDIVLDYITVSNPKKGEAKQCQIALVVGEKNRLKEQWSVMKKAGITLSAIDVTPFSLLNAIRVNRPDDLSGSCLYLDIGAIKTDVTFVRDGCFRLTRRLEMGGEQMTRKIEKKLNLSYDEAEKAKRKQGLTGDGMTQAALKNELNRFITEVQRSIDYYRSNFEEQHLKKVVVMGGGGLFPGFLEYVSSYFDSPVEFDNPFSNIVLDESQKGFLPAASRFSSVVGLALRSTI